MLRGVSFEGDGLGNFIRSFDEVFNVLAYEWYVDDIESNYLSFRAGEYTGTELRASLEKMSALSFVRLRRYRVGSSVRSIDEYKEYADSDCDVLILFYDGGSYEVYAKSESLIRELYAFCINRGFERTAYIDSTTDSRYSMHF